MSLNISHQNTPPKGAFVVTIDGTTAAEMTYSMAGDQLMIIDHTDVSDALRGQGAGKQLVLAAVVYARENNLKILPLCPFAASVFKKDQSLADVLK